MTIILSGERIPTRTFEVLYHVGTLDVTQSAGASLEGSGLSVSTEPGAWERIAKLGGRAWWELTREGNSFLDAHELSCAQREELLVWGEAQGYVARVPGWVVSWYDDELGREVSFSFVDYEEAVEEASSAASIAAASLVMAGSSWPDGRGRVNADQVLLALWAGECTALDGVWWQDDLNPTRLSAPRGVISGSCLVGWATTRIR